MGGATRFTWSDRREWRKPDKETAVQRLSAYKPPILFKIVGFVDGHKKRATVAREVDFGAEVVSMFWTERLAI